METVYVTPQFAVLGHTLSVGEANMMSHLSPAFGFQKNGLFIIDFDVNLFQLNVEI